MFSWILAAFLIFPDSDSRVDKCCAGDRQQKLKRTPKTYAAAKESVLNLHVLNASCFRKICCQTGAMVLAVLFLGWVVTGTLAAQTKVTAGQLPSLQGAVQGPTNSTLLRDIDSAVDHEMNGTGGIAGAITACGTTTACAIVIPPSYSTMELVPGFGLDPNNPPSAASTPGNITIFDQRYGDARMGINPRGYTDGVISSPNGWVYNYYAKQQPLAIIAPFYLLQNSWDGGTNNQYSSLGYFNKTTYAPLVLTNYSHTPGQHIGMGLTTKSFSIGDSLGFANYVYCWGGFNAQADEGCELQDNQVYMGSTAFEGTLAGSPTTGATSVSINVTQGENTQGAGRFLIRMSAGTITAGTISGITSTGTGLTTITGSSTAWPVSTMIATLGTNVSVPGSATVTPASFTTGSMTQITTSTLICVADQGAFEMVYPSAVSGSTFTATFAKVHPSTATIAAGGVCGYLLDLTADDATNATFPNKLQNIGGTLRFAWPAIASTSSGSLQLYVAGGGSYQQLVSRWDPSSANGYVLYPMAEVTSVQQGGGLSNTFTLGPNNVAWTAGDSVEEPLYPAGHFSFGNTTIESYYPNFPGTAGGFGLTYNFPMQGNDTMLSLINNTPTSMYKSYGGKYTSPIGIHISGKTGYSMLFDSPGDNWTIGVGCASPCTAVGNILAAANNASSYDYFKYDQTNRRFIITANSSGSSYTFGNTQMLTPFSNVSLGSDSSSVGYVATQSIRSGSGGNTDISGELSFSNATSATYTFSGSYNTHSECWAEPQFDQGSGNRHWITYPSNTSMTINFATAVTGAVSYGCVGRN